MRVFILITVVLSVCLLSGTRMTDAATPFVVNTTADPGDGACTAIPGGCTLREAITAANAQAGADEIHFAIPGAGVRTISVATDLPQITESVFIDGLTQPLSSCAPGSRNILVEVTAASSIAFGLDIFSGSNSRVRGLAVRDFGTNIYLYGAGGHKVECSNIGVNAAGTLMDIKQGIQVASANVTIGGGADRTNIIGGTSAAIILGPVTDTQITHNRIGRQAGDADLIAPDGFSPSNGVAAYGSTERVTVSQNEFGNYSKAVYSSAPQSDLDLRANDYTFSVYRAIVLESQEGGSVVITVSSFASNIIGVELRGDHSGTKITKNEFVRPDIGINAFDAGGFTVGGPLAPDGNTFIDAGTGVWLHEGEEEHPGERLVQGNVFSSSGAPRSDGVGILVEGAPLNGAGNVRIEQNTILSALDSGIKLSGAADVTLMNNLVGIDVNGVAGPNGIGIQVLNSGAVDIYGGRVSANSLGGIRVVNSHAVYISGANVGPNTSGEPAYSNQPVGISIEGGSGIRLASVGASGNAGPGIRALNSDGLEIVYSSARQNTGPGISIGATAPGVASNSVEQTGLNQNGGAGIVVFGPIDVFLHLNSYTGNGGPSIDLGADGLTANDDLDGDEGPNGLLNHPVLDSATIDMDGILHVAGTVSTLPAVIGFVDFYTTIGKGCGSSNRGSGWPLDFADGIPTDGDGSTAFVSELLASGVAPGDYVSALLRFGLPLTDAISSEFSNCVLVTSETSPFIDSLSAYSATIGHPGFQLVIRGSNFSPDAYVAWNDTVVGGTRLSSTEIQLAVGQDQLDTVGIADLRVVNPAPLVGPPLTDERSNIVPFAVRPAPVADADCSGFVNGLDALAVLRYLAGLDASACVEDANFDETIGIYEAAYIRRVVAGLAPE